VGEGHLPIFFLNLFITVPMRSVIVYVYNSADDPLFKGNLLPLLQLMSQRQPDLRFELITYEQQQYPLTAEERAQRTRDWAAANIHWHPLVWHSGSFKLIKKAYDLLVGLLLCLRLRLAGARSILAMCTVAGSFAFLIAKVLGLRYFGHQYEPHSEFMRDCGVWPETSMAYRGLHYVEGLVGRHADILSTGTSHMIERLHEWQSPARAYRLPTGVDEHKFQFTAAGRAAIRARHGLTAEQPVVLYLGKFGDLYYDYEIAEVFRALLDKIPDLHFLVATPDAPDHVTSLMARAGMPAGSVTITRSAYEEVPSYISAADMGLVAVPPLPSQRFRSPIKVGEYLCCGLPYLVCRGVSEDDLVATKYNVGVVVDAFTTAEAVRVAPQVAAFLAEDRDALRSRCRQAGIAYRGLDQFVPVADEIFKQL
jgi:glycosyltransferase involved in cell wall biosynthesis